MKHRKRFLTVFLLCMFAFATCFLLASCNGQPEIALKTAENSVEIDVAVENSAEIDLSALLEGQTDDLSYAVHTADTEITLSDVENGKVTVTSGGTAGQYTVSVSVLFAEKEILSFEVAVNVTDSAPTLSLKNATNAFAIDLDKSDSGVLHIKDLINGNVAAGVSFAASGDDGVTVSRLNDSDFTVTAKGTVGKYKVHVEAKYLARTILSFDVDVNVTDSVADPTVKAAATTEEVKTFLFPDGTTDASYTIDPADLFDADAAITYEAVCEDPTVTVTRSAGKLVVNATTTGNKEITVYALKRNVRKVSAKVTLDIKGETPAQLLNGDFEKGYLGWNMTAEEKAAYTLYNSPVDIWQNPNNSTGTQLYGFGNEAFADADFTSSLFKVSGSGIITWKMGGNCTERLQLKLMKYVADGDDVEIARFNNWYYGVYAGSAFIMRSYYYQIDMTQYADDCFYFEVVDKSASESNGFAFLCLDDIVTYYAAAPDVSECYLASYCVAPPTLTLAQENNEYMAEITEPSAEVDLNRLFTQAIDGRVVFTAACEEEDITLSAIADNKFTATGTEIGSYTIAVTAKFNNVPLLTFDVTFEIVAEIEEPTAKEKTVTDDATVALYPDGTVYAVYEKPLSDLFDAVAAITYNASSEDEGVEVAITNDGKLSVTATSTGSKTITVNALKLGVVKATVTLTLNVSDVPTAQLLNGGFESGYLGWQLTDEEKAAYTLYNSSADIFGNANNATGTHLYGYGNESFADADFTSSLFKVSGSGYVTWKMGGNCTERLQLKLMKYVADGDDVEVAKFNNWYFGAFGDSAFIMRSYCYRIDMSEYENDWFYFEVIDNSASESNGYAFLCLDDIVTYYAAAPDVSGYYPAGYCVAPPTLTLVEQTNRISALANEASDEVDLATLFTNAIDSALVVTVTCADENVTLSALNENKFTATGTATGNYTIVVTAKYNNGIVSQTEIAFGVFDELPAAREETVEGDALVVLYVDGTMEATYEIELVKLFDAMSSTTYEATCSDATVNAEIVGKKLSVSATSAGDKTIVVNASKGGTVKATVTLTLHVSDVPTAQLVNGDFESGYLGWKLTDEEKAAYTLYNSPEDIWHNPNNSTGTQLYGFGNEAFANADFTSSLFKVSGSGVITWKMAGNCTERLQLKLMKYVADGDDVEVAKFNNWYFGAFGGSAFIMRSYCYQIDMTQYADDWFYFEVIDKSASESNGFPFLCLDDIVTYYETDPEITCVTEGNKVGYYLAGYCTNPNQQ